MYVDFGNKEVVSKTELRVLDAEFMTDPVHCYCCRLYDIQPVTSPFISVFHIYFYLLLNGGN